MPWIFHRSFGRNYMCFYYTKYIKKNGTKVELSTSSTWESIGMAAPERIAVHQGNYK